MNKIIEEAIETYNLSPLEEYYLDHNNRIRARGFIYDEDTGIFINEYGLLELELPVMEERQERVRDILDFNTEMPVLVYPLDLAELETAGEAVA